MDERLVAMSNSRYSRSGTRRVGDDYQDMVALEWLVEMLEHPDRYEWVRVEADDAGILDDVVAKTANGRLMARQVKYSTNPERDDDLWTWGSLLQSRTSPTGRPLPSLIMRLAESWEMLSTTGEAEAELVSNRRAAPDVEQAREPSGRVRFDQIPNERRSEIVAQLGGEDRARSFFQSFSLRLDRPGLGVLEDGLRRRFALLGGRDEGWLSLKDELRRWVVKKDEPPPDGHITIAAVREAARWRHLKSLPEEFEVPDDFVLPSEAFHGRFTELISERNCVVITGKPGLGKSTYLSFLVQELKEKGIPVIRHHYFLSTRDRTTRRLDHRRIAESLMTDLQSVHADALEGLDRQNPDPESLASWIEACGRYFESKDKCLYVVLDGLDHVWRETNSRDQLNALFETMLPSPPGVRLIVGTRPVDDIRLPQRLLNSAPRCDWVDLPSLDYGAVREWLKKHASELELPDEEHARGFQLDRLAQAFLAKSDGVPLHLRYTLIALQERGLPRTPEAVTSLPGVTHQDIERYYDELWRDLSEPAREILHLLAATRFPWPPRGLVDCLEAAGRQRPRVVEARRQVGHLLEGDVDGDRASHSSLLAYVVGREEHQLYARNLQEKALTWLRNDAPESWRYAYEWLLEADLGDDEPLLAGPNRPWVVRWVARRYPLDQLAEILGRSAWIALTRRNLQRFVDVGLLRDYVLQIDYRPDVLPALLPAQLWLQEDDYLRLRLRAGIEKLTDEELALLAREEHVRDDAAAVRDCLDEMNRRVSGPIPRTVSFGLDDWRARLAASGRIAALAGIETERIARFASQFEEDATSEAILEAVASTLRGACLMDPLRLLMREDLCPSGKLRVARHATMLALEQGVQLSHEELPKEMDVYSSFYASLRNENTESRGTKLPDLPDIRSLDYFDRQPAVLSFFHSAFFYLLTNRLEDRAEASQWMTSLTEDRWVRDILALLDAAAHDIATALSERRPSGPSLIFRHFEGIARPRFSTDREHTDLGDGLCSALREIAMDLMAISRGISGQAAIGELDLDLAFATDYCNPWAFIGSYVDAERQWMPDDVAASLLKRMEGDLANSIADFPTRALRFAKLARLACRHGFEDDARRLVGKAAEDTIAYGEHKDLLLDSVVEVLKACHQAGVGESEKLLVQLAPVVAAVEDFTDGDETSHLQGMFGEALCIISPERIPAYYRWLCDQERYNDAETVFGAFLSSADLTHDLHQALARTAVDARSLHILSKRAARGDPGAGEALGALEDVLGPLNLQAASSAVEERAAPQWESRTHGRPGADPISFPPPQLEQFLEASGSMTPYDREHRARSWLHGWVDAGQARQALDAVAKLVDSDTRLRVSDDLFYLALAHRGRSEAYRWLVRAQRDNHGWFRFFGQKEETLGRWQAVKENYPERWFEFVVDSIASDTGEKWEHLGMREVLLRLAEYFIFVNRTDIAEGICGQAVCSVLDLVSPLQLPTPGWITEAPS